LLHCKLEEVAVEAITLIPPSRRDPVKFPPQSVHAAVGPC